ncbi:MAG TPA: substrate-binding domain-containing protein [Solirubrobacterales bacterium]|nr:substrate-binding domain-containing protein [Solirubrobacterales bacterium]
MAASLVALVLVVAGCGGGGSSSSSNEGSTESGGENANLPALGPTSKDPKISVKPRTIGVLDVSREAPIDNNTDETIIAAGKALGWDVKVVNAGGNPEKITKGAEALIGEGVDGFISVSVEGPSIRQALTTAKSNGTPTCSVLGGEAPADLYDAQYEEDETKMGSVAAGWYLENETSPKLIVLKSTTIPAGRLRLAGFLKQLEGSGAEVVFEREINLEDPVGETAKAVQDALVAAPDATAVWPEYDGFTQTAASTVQREGKDLPVLGYYASPGNLQSLNSGGPIKVILDNNVAKGAAVCLDQFLKHFETGAAIDRDALKKAGGLEYILFDAENAKKYLYPGLPESANVDHVFPPGAILKPFLAQWRNEYPGQ